MEYNLTGRWDLLNLGSKVGAVNGCGGNASPWFHVVSVCIENPLPFRLSFQKVTQGLGEGERVNVRLSTSLLSKRKIICQAGFV
jgi:hypothetical protein